MNIVFFGSANFAVPSFKSLLGSGHKVACVVTQPDRQKGRGLHLTETVIKQIAQEAGLKIHQPSRINLPQEIEILKKLNPDLFIVVAYGQILSQDLLDIPRIFSVNVHASLLPRYRGAAPINRALINGDKVTGITVIKMAKEMDAGPIILQKSLEINKDDTVITLEDKLSHLAAEALLSTLESVENRNYSLTAQDQGKVSLAPKLKKEDGLINWGKTAQEIYNLIRGCVNWPGAITYYKGKLLKLYKAKVLEFLSSGVLGSPGEIIQVSKGGIIVATGGGNLQIEELQLEGKRRMKVEEFIRGNKICVGEVFREK